MEVEKGWVLEKKINPSTVGAFLMAGFGLVTWGNSISNGMDNMRREVSNLKAEQVQLRVDQNQIRNELLTQANGIRTELLSIQNQQRDEFRQEFRELRRTIEKVGGMTK